MEAPDHGDDWVALSPDPLPAGAALEWVVVPHCGGQVVFTGTVRDHAEGRDGVTHLEYEAWPEQAQPRMAAVVQEARNRWPELGRVAVLHRTGRLELGDVAVVVAVSAPHRAEAFEAARFCIDTVKAAVPIWKKESWRHGSDWGTGAQHIEAGVRPPAEVPGR